MLGWFGQSMQDHPEYSGVRCCPDLERQMELKVVSQKWIALDFQDFCGHRYARLDKASNASGLTPLRWLCRRVRCCSRGSGGGMALP